MKKNAKKIFVMLLLAVVASGSYFISGTYAKYSKALSGSDTATVAKFSVSATDLGTAASQTISLFDTLKDDDTTTDEAHVKTGSKLIAPGTSGKFTTTLTNDSEVDVEAVVTLEETNEKNVPIEYSLDGTTWVKVDDTTKKVELTSANLDYAGKASGTSSKDVDVYWRWAFGDDASVATDTPLGETSPAPTVTTKVVATFTQID